MGLSSEVGLPTYWSEDEGVIWKIEVEGKGNSTPIVSNGIVFLTSTLEKEVPEGEPAQLRRVVMAFDFETGAQLWQTEVFSDGQEKLHHMSTSAAPTPVTDGELLYVYFGSVIAALDFEGNVAWQREIEPQYARFSRYGAASSPVLTKDAVIIVQDREYSKFEMDDIGWIGAYSRADGSQLWRTEWDDTCCSYTTPLVVDRGAGEEIIVAQSAYTASYDAATGERLWNQEYEINQIVSGPVLDGDLLVVTGGAHNVKSSLGIMLEGAGKDTVTEVIWTGNQMVPETSSAVLHDGLVYSVTIKGVLLARDAYTGEVVWRDRVDQRGNNASLVLADGKLYVGQGYGKTTVLEAGREFKVLSQNILGDKLSTASPAVAGGSILLRSQGHLYRIGNS
jgi:outer membrane protein assembly factor BamB